jgi:hypothetical protein
LWLGIFRQFRINSSTNYLQSKALTFLIDDFFIYLIRQIFRTTFAKPIGIIFITFSAQHRSDIDELQTFYAYDSIELMEVLAAGFGTPMQHALR